MAKIEPIYGMNCFNNKFTLREFLNSIGIQSNSNTSFMLYESKYPKTPIDTSRKCLETNENMKEYLERNVLLVESGYDPYGFQCITILVE